MLDTDWDIRREARSWSATETRNRGEFRPEKLEIWEGKLLWSDDERTALAALLIENLGADRIVRLGALQVWVDAVNARRAADAS